MIQYWGWENLRRWPPSAVQGLRIPETSRRFLIDVGLPVPEGSSLTVGPGTEHFPPLPWCPGLRTLCHDDDLPICIDEGREGRVVMVEAEYGGPVCFVNSSVEQFGMFLLLSDQATRLAEGLPENQVAAVTTELEAKMKGGDPAALFSPGNYWPALIQQVRDGFPW